MPYLIGHISCSGPVDECDDKGSHDQPNTPNEQGQLPWQHKGYRIGSNFQWMKIL